MWAKVGMVVALVAPLCLGIVFFLAARDPSRNLLTRALTKLYRPMYPKDPQGALLGIALTLFATWGIIVLGVLLGVASTVFWGVLLGSLILSLAAVYRRWLFRQ